MKRAPAVALVILIQCLVSWANSEQDIPVFMSNDGVFFLKTASSHKGLCLVQTETGDEVVITKNTGAGYYASISPDNRFVCLKLLQKDKAGAFKQTPALYDIPNKRLIHLYKSSHLAGTPAVSLDGKIAFTIGKKLIILNENLDVIKTFVLDHYVNLIAFSPQGDTVAYTDNSEQIITLSLKDSKTRTLTDGKAAYWDPQFSPAGDKILSRTVDGRVVCISLNTEKINLIGEGLNPAWVNNDTVAFIKKTIEAQQVTKTEICFASADGVSKCSVSLSDGDETAAIGGRNIVFTKSGTIIYAILTLQKSGAAMSDEFPIPRGKITKLNSDNKIYYVPHNISADTTELSNVPYIHQVYDTPNWFNGNWACGATAATMCLTFYNLLDNWDCTCSSPYEHTSHWGRYICETYTYNGFTFDIASDDPWGNPATGGYGYITQNNWENTKTHMRDYVRIHGPSSEVDWSPTWDEAKTDINNNYPFVMLNSLTSGGHYITWIGYFNAQHTMVANDPYGDKNDGYKNYYGNGAYYDWPGYNNGYANLNTVHCFIYCRIPKGDHQFEAEDYSRENFAAEGYDYHDTTAGNSGGKYRSDDVDIEPCSEGGYNVAWIASGEWLRYYWRGGGDATYSIEIRYAGKSNGTCHIEVDDYDKTGAITLPATSGWQTWASAHSQMTVVNAGTHKVKLVMDSSGFNINWFKFIKTQITPTPTPTATPTPTLTATPTPVISPNGWVSH